MSRFIQYLCATLGQGADPRVGARIGLAAADYANENKVPLKTMKAAAVIALGNQDALVRIEYVQAAIAGGDLKGTADQAHKDRRRLARIRKADRKEAAAKAEAKAKAARKRKRAAAAKAKAEAAG